MSEAAFQSWHKSLRSGAYDNCVEVALDRDRAGMRDSKDPHGVVLEFTGEAWRGFIDDVKAGRFDT